MKERVQNPSVESALSKSSAELTYTSERASERPELPAAVVASFFVVSIIIIIIFRSQLLLLLLRVLCVLLWWL